MAKLSDPQIQDALGDLHGWEHRDDALTKRFSFPTFSAGIAFVNRVAVLAEQKGHHPDITIRYTTIECSLSTHDAGGVTEKDVDLARGIELLATD